MKKRNLLAIMISGLVLAAAPMMGCGETDDPSLQNQNQTNQSQTNQTDNQTETNQTETNQTETNQTETNQTETNQTETNQTETNQTETNQNGGEGCSANPLFFGQVGSDAGANFAGGVRTTDPFADDAGLQAIYDRIAEIENNGGLERDSNGYLVDIDISDNPITIDGATVTSTDHGDRSRRVFWLGDSEAGMAFFQSAGDGPVPDPIYVGHRIKLDVTTIGFYNDNPSIRGYENWELVGENGPVSYIEVESGDFTVEDHFTRVIRIAGEIGEDPYACGGDYTCFDLIYGENDAYSVTYRVDTTRMSGDIFPGDCITYVGPLSTFPGLYSENPHSWQIQVDNFQWQTIDFTLD